MEFNGKLAISGFWNFVPQPSAPNAPNISSISYSTVYTSNANISVTANITPGYDGGWPIAGYTLISIPEYRSNTNTTNVVVLNNLTRGQTYTFVANAYHIAGSSPNSITSASYTLAQVPDAPTMGTATATGATTANVTFTAPNNGGANITSYTATSIPAGGTGTLSQAGSGTIDVTGLTVFVTYTFIVAATNSIGTSANSAASNQITTYSAPVNTVAPAVTGTATNGQTLTSTTGTWTGTATITYAYQWQRAGVNISGATSSTYVLTASDAGNAIRCVVTATNPISAVSANSNATASVAAIAPSAPTIGTATLLTSTSATVTFTAPASNGGATITSYTATSSPGSITGTLSQAGSGTITVSGLTAGTTYTFTVTATNSAGTSSASSTSNSITYIAPASTSYTSAGTYSFIPTTGVTSVSVVAVGGGGGGGNYGGNYGTAHPYLTLPYQTVGGDSYFNAPTTVKGGGGGVYLGLYGCAPVSPYSASPVGPGFASGGTYTGDGGGNGGGGSYFANSVRRGAGGGAGGYSGTGGAGWSNPYLPGFNCMPPTYSPGADIPGTAGSGGGGGGGISTMGGSCQGGGSGGGVGIFGQGTSAPATYACSVPNTTEHGPWQSKGGFGGSGGANGAEQPRQYPYNNSTFVQGVSGGNYGGGGGVSDKQYAGGGGGGLGYKNNYPVTPGTPVTVVVGAGGTGGGGSPYYTNPNPGVTGGPGGSGAVRVVWPGSTRTFPTTCVGSP